MAFHAYLENSNPTVTCALEIIYLRCYFFIRKRFVSYIFSQELYSFYAYLFTSKKQTSLQMFFCEVVSFINTLIEVMSLLVDHRMREKQSARDLRRSSTLLLPAGKSTVPVNSDRYLPNLSLEIFSD